MAVGRVSPAALDALSAMVGLTIPPVESEAVATVLSGVLSGVAVFDRLDLADVDPLVVFDPRWR